MELKKQQNSALCLHLSTDQTSEEFTTTSRPLANYHPSLWGNTFLLPIQESNETIKAREEQSLTVEALKQELKTELKETAALKQLQLIDAIQRLGVQYHFEDEIHQALQTLFDKYQHFCLANNDLYSTALSFRLLRQHGYKVPCEIFEKFKDDKGDFKDFITVDVMGLLEFYEATYLSIQGEDVLDHGLAFTTTQLQSMLPDLTINPIAEQLVANALTDYSNRRGLTRLEARKYISIYEQNASHHEALLKLAKLDFNLLQSLHKRELSVVCRWWKGLDVEKKLPFIRDRMVECYFWILGVYFEPQYSLARRILSQVQAIASILNDTYDAYATFEELQIFTQAIERWSMSCLDSLPEYMALYYKALLELFEEIEDEMIRQGRSYRVDYGKEAVKEMARAYFDEAKWRKERYTPTMEEYMEVATRSCCYTSLTIISFLGVGDEATREAFDFVLSQPDIVKATLIICRLTDDIVGHEFERKRDHIPSAIECYIKEHNVCKEEAIEEFNNYIERAWKDINQGFFRPTEIPASLLDRILNFARVIEVMYKKGDWYTNVGPEMQSYIKQILIDPIPE